MSRFYEQVAEDAVEMVARMAAQVWDSEDGPGRRPTAEEIQQMSKRSVEVTQEALRYVVATGGTIGTLMDSLESAGRGVGWESVAAAKLAPEDTEAPETSEGTDYAN